MEYCGQVTCLFLNHPLTLLKLCRTKAADCTSIRIIRSAQRLLLTMTAFIFHKRKQLILLFHGVITRWLLLILKEQALKLWNCGGRIQPATSAEEESQMHTSLM